jgi:hypothetical protein
VPNTAAPNTGGVPNTAAPNTGGAAGGIALR